MALLRPPVGPRAHTLGTVEAPVTLVEYGDFECPFCGRAYPDLKQVLRQVGGKVQFVFRHFPLSEEHPHAQHAAEVAEAAAAQGKFWEMHRSEEHTSELQSQSNLVCRLLLEKKKHPKVTFAT